MEINFTNIICCCFPIEFYSGFIPQIITAIILIGGYFLQYCLFNRQMRIQQEETFKTNSVKIIFDLQKQFEDLVGVRCKIAENILKSDILELKEFSKERYNEIALIEEVLDFFTSIGMLVKEKYIKSDLVWCYFYYWFSNYFYFYKKFKIKELSTHRNDSSVWNNLEWLNIELEKIENLKSVNGRIIEKDLDQFFKEEKEYK